MTKLFQFNPRGIAELEQILESKRNTGDQGKGKQGSLVSLEDLESIEELAFQDELIEEIPSSIELDSKMEFATRLDMAIYIYKALKDSGIELTDSFWAWLSVFYIKKLCHPTKSGEYRLNESYRFIPSSERRRVYRHLLKTNHDIYSKYKDISKLFLSGKTYEHGDIVEQVYSGKMTSNLNLLQAAVGIFYDESQKKVKPGVRDKIDKAGSLRRLTSVVSKQLSSNYDLYEKPPQKIVDILPSEFDRWK